MSTRSIERCILLPGTRVLTRTNDADVPAGVVGRVIQIHPDTGYPVVQVGLRVVSLSPTQVEVLTTATATDPGKRDEDQPTTLGGLVRSLRRSPELTHKDLATTVGCSISFVSLIERDKRVLSAVLERRFADALRVSDKDRPRWETLVAEARARPVTSWRPIAPHSPFPLYLRRLRARYGLSQSAFVVLTGASRLGVYHLERGHHRPSVATLARIAERLDLPRAERLALIEAAGFPLGSDRD